MSKQVLKTVYDFEEVREKAIEKNRYWLVDDGSYWYQNVFWDCEDELKKIGFMNPKIDFEGFWSQGDGACFDADVDVEKLLNHLLETKKLNEDEIKTLKTLNFEISIIKVGAYNLYCHERTRKIDVTSADTDCDNLKILLKLQNIIEELRLELCIKFYKLLEDEYEYMTSDDAVATWLDDAYWFNEDGTIYDSK